MEIELEEEKEELDLSVLGRRGGFRTLPLIVVNELLEKVASYGLMPNMIFYLINDYHMEVASGSIILSTWGAFSNALGILGALLSDSLLGRFRVIILGSISSLLGMSVLWLTATYPHLRPPPCEQHKSTCISPTSPQLIVLFSSFALISIGAGCIRPCSMAFGADQLDNKENPNNERVLQSFINWYYASTGLSVIIALTLIVYIQENWGWKIGFAVPAILMALSIVVFVMGSSIYVKVEASRSSLSGIVNVLMAALRKRKTSPPASDDDESELKPLTESSNGRLLNRTHVTSSENVLNPDDSFSETHNLCTVDQLNALKAFRRVLPMWTTGIVFSISMGQLSFSTIQANTMNRHITSNFEIPAVSYIIFMIFTIMAWVVFYDRIIVPLLAKYTKYSQGFSPQLRIGLGILTMCIASSLAAIVESTRRSRAIDEGFKDDVNKIVNMSAMWLVPQYIIQGLAEALNANGQIEFYYSQFPKSMSSVPMALFTFSMAVSSVVGSVLVKTVDRVTSRGGNVSWLSSNINKGHIDYYYWFATFLGFLNFIYFLFCYQKYTAAKDDNVKFSAKLDQDSNYTGS